VSCNRVMHTPPIKNHSAVPKTREIMFYLEALEACVLGQNTVFRPLKSSQLYHTKRAGWGVKQQFTDVGPTDHG
jgi:hypothetical protein